MEVTSLAALATNMRQTELDNAVQVAVLRKALNIESQGALQLLQAASQSMAATSNNPPHLGNIIDGYA
jgi:hypothetical protein